MEIYFFLPAKAGFFIGFSLFVLSFYLYNEKKRRMGGTYGMKIKTYEADVVVLNEEKGFAALKKAAESGRKLWDTEKIRVVIDKKVPPNSPEESKGQQEVLALARKLDIPHAYGRGMAFHLLVEESLPEGFIAVSGDPDVYVMGAFGGKGYCLDEEGLEEVLLTGSFSIQEGGVFNVFLSTKETRYDRFFREGYRPCNYDKAYALSKKIPQGMPVCISGELQEFRKEELAVMCMAAGRASGCTAFVKENVQGFHIRIQYVPSVVIHEETEISQKGRIPISAVFIGGAQGGFLEDIRHAADIIRGEHVSDGVRLSVAPATAEVYKKAADLGYIKDIMDAGGIFLNQCADPSYKAKAGKGEILLTNDNKDYGDEIEAAVFHVSTERAANAAVRGYIGGEFLKRKRQEEAEAPVLFEEKAEESEKPALGTKSLSADPILAFSGRVWKFGDDIDTDIIIPTQHLSYPSWDEIKKHMFELLRPELAEEVREGDILVAGNNFGCGSSREQAAEVLSESGIRCIIAKSFARIFFRNAVNNGILLIECAALFDDVEEGDTVIVVPNEYILCKGKKYPIPKVRGDLLSLIMDGGLVKHVQKERGR